MIYPCPKGCDSTDADFCSECGTRIGGSVLNIANSSPLISIIQSTPSATEKCPDCGTVRTPGGRFCEVCQFDFSTQTSRQAAIDIPSPDLIQSNVDIQSSESQSAIPPSQLDLNTAPVRLKVVVMIDQNLASQSESTPPADRANRIFPLDLDENLVGRRSNAKQIFPEIEVSDPGVSHRHCQIIRQGNDFAVLELGSANGTKLNQRELEPGVALVLHPGDELLMGLWTRIQIVERN